MRKFLPHLKTLLCLMICVAVCIGVPCAAFVESRTNSSSAEKSVLRVWEIDNFEGGKGSRTDFLQRIGNEFSDIAACYITVTSLSADAARLNMQQGNIPDIISYGAGIYGIENYITGWSQWCRGGYCFLTTDTNSDFSDIGIENTVINGGKENFVGAAALLCGISGADVAKPTAAYVKLLNGEYKYLLGTQRDIYRLKMRGAAFSVRAISEFNDLYQNISVTKNCADSVQADRFIEYLLSKNADVTALGLFTDKSRYDDEMKELENVAYEYKLTTPISAETETALRSIIESGDINSLKNLLK